MLLNFFIFKKIMQHQEQALMLHTQRGLGWGVCWWEQWFLIQVLLMFLPYSCEHMCETGWQDSVEITHFQTLFNAENTVVTSQIFLSSSVINCWKTVNEWSVLKIKHGAACSLFIMCADFGGSTLHRHSRRALNTAAVFFENQGQKYPGSRGCTNCTNCTASRAERVNKPCPFPSTISHRSANITAVIFHALSGNIFGKNIKCLNEMIPTSKL